MAFLTVLFQIGHIMLQIVLFMLEFTLVFFPALFHLFCSRHIAVLDIPVFSTLIGIDLLALYRNFLPVVRNVVDVFSDVAVILANLRIVLLDLINGSRRLCKNRQGDSSNHSGNEQFAFHISVLNQH